MTDLALAFDQATFSADLLLDAGKLATADGMRTAIWISLFTDARARVDDPLPEPGADRRGWWGDSEARDDGEQTGSRLWLLARSKIVPATLTRAREYAAEALAWLVEDQIASSVDIEVEAQRPDRLAIGVTIVRPTGPDRQRYDFVWTAS